MLSPDDLGPADRALLDLLREGRVTAPYAAEEADYSLQYVRDRLGRLVEHGNAQKVHEGLYELVADPRDADSAERPAERGAERPAETATDSAAETTADTGSADSVPTAGADTPEGVERVRAVGRDHLEEEFASWDSQRIAEGAEAAVAAYQYLTQEGSASMREFVAEVAVEHSVGYSIDPPEEGERYRGAWWRKVVRPVLGELPDVQEPTAGGEWQYVGNND